MRKRRLLAFILGIFSFIVSQVLLRMPLLEYLQNSTDFLLFYTYNTLLVGILIAASAGVFEEGFRFIFKSLFFKGKSYDILQPILFGLGHGLVEAIIILSPAIGIMSFNALILPMIERILAITLHIGLTVIIWNGFQLNKKYRYLFLAVMIHSIVNSFIPIILPLENGIIIFESLFALFNILMIVYIYRSRKNYHLEEKNI